MHWLKAQHGIQPGPGSMSVSWRHILVDRLRGVTKIKTPLCSKWLYFASHEENALGIVTEIYSPKSLNTSTYSEIVVCFLSPEQYLMFFFFSFPSLKSNESFKQTSVWWDIISYEVNVHTAAHLLLSSVGHLEMAVSGMG